jgi:hypothetical protein
MKEMKELTPEEEMMEKGYLTSPSNAVILEKILERHHINKPDRVR